MQKEAKRWHRNVLNAKLSGPSSPRSKAKVLTATATLRHPEKLWLRMAFHMAFRNERIICQFGFQESQNCSQPGREGDHLNASGSHVHLEKSLALPLEAYNAGIPIE